MPNLKLLKLKQLDGLKAFPDVSGAPNIEKLFVSACKNLVEVHESLGSHKRLVRLHINGCGRLKRLPFRFEMESLRFLILNKCSSLERFPDVSPCMVKLSFMSLDYCSGIQELPTSFVYLSSLGDLNLRRYENHKNINALESLPKSIILHNLTNSCCLKTLNLSCRQIESEDFPKNFQAFSYLENLDLSGNNKLIRLPASISHLSRLRKLNLNECFRLQILHGLPSGIQVLQANNCCSLEKTEYPSDEYDDWYRISFINCQKLVGVEDNERYLYKMLQQSFLKRCAVIDSPLMIGIPGNKIPRWFKEEQPGYNIALMIPPKCNTQIIIGIAICGVFHGEWQGTHYEPLINVTFKKDGKSIIQKVVDCPNSYRAARNGNTWISYRPCSSFRAFQCEDWSGGTLLFSITAASGAKAVKCAALLMYKEDGESNQEIRTCIARPWMTRKDKQRSIHVMPPHLRPPKNSRNCLK